MPLSFPLLFRRFLLVMLPAMLAQDAYFDEKTRRNLDCNQSFRYFSSRLFRTRYTKITSLNVPRTFRAPRRLRVIFYIYIYSVACNGALVKVRARTRIVRTAAGGQLISKKRLFHTMYRNKATHFSRRDTKQKKNETAINKRMTHATTSKKEQTKLTQHKSNEI